MKIKDETKAKIWGIIVFLSLLFVAIIAAFTIVKFILANIFPVIIIIELGLMFLIATQKEDERYCPLNLH